MEEVWGGEFCIPDLSAFQSGVDYSLQEFVGVSLLGFFTLLILFRKSLPAFFRLFYSSLFYRADLQKIEQVPQYRIFRMIFLVILSFLSVAAMSLLGFLDFDPASSGWWRPLLSVVLWSLLYFFFRRCMLSVMGRVTGYRELFTDAVGLLYLFYSMAVFWLLLTACFTGFGWWVIAGLLLLYTGYLIYLGRRFLFSKVSFFFTFLYLCTLEFLVPFLWIGINIKLIKV